MNRLFRRQRDERGAILIMATVGVVLAVISAALAVDLGRHAQERRRDQKVADLAALDAVRDLANVDAVAKASALRNSFPSGPGFSVTGVEGVKVDGACVPQPGAGSACVTVRSTISNIFRPGDGSIRAVAVASRENKGSFSIGSSLASLDPSDSVLDQYMRRIINASGPVNVVSYNGLASANVTLKALQQQLLNAGLDVGSVDKLLNTSMSLRQLLTATASALGPGNPAAAADVNGIALAANSTLMVKLGDLIEVAQGSDNAALASQVNVFRLVTGSAAVANGTNTISIPSLTVSIPNVTNVSVSLKITELPKMYIGPTYGPQPHAQTSQVELTVSPTIDLSIPLVARVTGTIPVNTAAAKATGNLVAVDCDTPTGITVDATTGAATVSAGATLTVRLLTLLGEGVPLNVLNVALNGNAGSGSHPGLDFTYSGDYGPPGQHVGNTTAGLGTLLTASTGNALVNAVLDTITAALRPILNTVDTAVVRPLLKAAGADMGTADVIAHPVEISPGPPAVLDGAWCGDIALIG
ncbi:MAG: pilus assembly protein TadG-related protein [Acidimicrobiia bacterium]